MQTQSVEDTAVRTGLRIIHLEDDQNDAELIARQLAKDGVAAAVKRVRTKEEFIRALNERAPELILADYRIPGFDGLDALKVAREKYPETPFIFVSGAIGEEFAIETLTHGATDYVLKDRLVRLVPALRRSLHDARLRVERAHARERLKTMNRELEMVNECHRLAIRSKNEKTLLDQICRKLVELGGYRMSWAGLLVANAQGALAPAAKAGYEMGYVKSIQKNAAPASSAIEPAFVAVRTGEIVVNRNTRSNPTPFPWKEEALERGYASSIALPLTIDNRIIGALSIYAERPDSFHPEEARLLGALAEDLAFGIGALRARSGRTRAVREMRLSHRQLLQSNKRLEKIAIKDPLTGLYNNRYLSDALGAELTRAGRFAQHLSLIILDIDYFKSINSVYGRAFGDTVLKQFAGVLQATVRKYDTVIRSGGGEFVILAPSTNGQQAILFAKRLESVINQHKLGDAKRPVTMKASIAIATYPEDTVGRSGELLDIAETVLAKAKEDGGGRICALADVDKRGDAEKIPAGARVDAGYFREKIERLTKKANRDLLESIFALAKTIEVKDSYTGRHVESTVQYATAIAAQMKLPAPQIETIRQAAMLHDLGKIGISEQILLKPGKLTDKEFEAIKKHPQIGADVIRQIHPLRDVVPLVLYHHERWDGKGYPIGIKGQEIPIGARIVAVADVYQALTSNRPYRNSFSKKKALEIIKEGAGTQFDPKVVEACFEVLKKKR